MISDPEIHDKIPYYIKLPIFILKKYIIIYSIEARSFIDITDII